MGGPLTAGSKTFTYIKLKTSLAKNFRRFCNKKKAACATLLLGSTGGLNLPKYSILCSFRGSNPYSCLNPHFCIYFNPFFVRFGLTLTRQISLPNSLKYEEKPPISAVFSMCIFFVYPLCLYTIKKIYN